MRPVATAFSLVLLASPALADRAPSSHAQSIDLADVPQRCRAVSEIPHSARVAEPAFSARISAASCMAQIALDDRELTDDAVSIERANAVTAPLIATLDEVIAHGDAATQIVAEYTKGDLLFGLQTRLRESIPQITSHTSLEAAQALERRHRSLDPKLVPWDRQATDAFRRVEEIARANPEIADSNRVLQYMTREAHRLLVQS
jgi:hypothetical protein